MIFTSTGHTTRKLRLGFEHGYDLGKHEREQAREVALRARLANLSATLEPVLAALYGGKRELHRARAEAVARAIEEKVWR